MEISYNGFLDRVKTEILDYMPEHYKEHKVRINTIDILEQKVDLMVLLHPSTLTAPGLNMRDYFREFLSCWDMDKILKRIAEDYIEQDRDAILDAKEEVGDFSMVEDNICFRLVNQKTNEELLKNFVHTKVADFAKVYSLLLSKDENTIVGIDIPKQMLEIWDVSISEIDQAAEKNTAEQFLPKLRNCDDIIKELKTGKIAENLLERSKPVEEGVMFSLSNTAAMMGASAGFYPGIHEKVRSLVGDDYYMIPLNVDEVIIAPKKNVPDGIRTIEKMLWTSNMLLPEKMVLSDVIFEYTQKDRTLKPAWEQDRNRKSRDFER